MHIHFIAIGGSAMHNLAIALHKKGYKITGSDDEVFEPSKSRLQKYGLLPDGFGWDINNISANLDAVILGMHAREDNPELLKAQELGVKVYSYPEYLYEQTKNKTRVVIGGSHGKTTITSMVMHVLKENNLAFDYMVGANLEGFETMVGLNDDTGIAVFEGDEYLSSPIDRRPKFHLYKPHIALLTGIAWDHINVFPTFENYVQQFEAFVGLVEPGGYLTYFQEDGHIQEIVSGKEGISIEPYITHQYVNKHGKTCLLVEGREIPIHVFGNHNLQNISGAKNICLQLGITERQFYTAISSFKGAGRRLQVLAENEKTIVYQDFAHSPSKLKATTEAVKKQFPERALVACMELHTFSSLKKEFLPQYKHCMDEADVAFVYYNPHTVAHKKLEPITKQQVFESFGKEGLVVTTDSDALFAELQKQDWQNKNLLLMSSGNFDGKGLKEIAVKIVG